MSSRRSGISGRRWPLPIGSRAVTSASAAGGIPGATAAGPPNPLWAPRKGKGAAPHRPTITSSLVAALMAVGVVVGFVLIRTGNPTVSGQTAPTPSIPGTRATVPPGQSSAPLASGAPTTAPTSPPVTSATSSPGTRYCTPADVEVSSATDSSAYGPGRTVTVTTLLRAARTCVFQPVPTGQYSCASTIVVTDAGGSQVFPWPGQPEQCSPPAPTVLQPGVTESLRAAWNQRVSAGGAQQAQPGSYQALGTWAWSSGPGQAPYQVSARSQPFVIG